MWLVFTLQKLQPRVHVSPISMMVAVAVPSLPPQHSPRLGHFASSHTVARLSDFTEAERRSTFSRRLPVGASMRSHVGFSSRSSPEEPAAGTVGPSGSAGAQPGVTPKEDSGGDDSNCSRRRVSRSMFEAVENARFSERRSAVLSAMSTKNAPYANARRGGATRRSRSLTSKRQEILPAALWLPAL